MDLVSCCSVLELFTKDFLDVLKCWESECPRELNHEMNHLHISIFRLLSLPFSRQVFYTDAVKHPLKYFLDSELVGISFLMSYIVYNELGEISLFSCCCSAPHGGGICSS